MTSIFSLPSQRRIFLLLAPPLCGLIALSLGMDASWDLRNYHYYNGWALLHGHLHRDLLVSQIPSFYNPLLDLPFAWAAGWMDARVLAFLLGSLHGGNIILLTLLGEALLAGRPQPGRSITAMALALLGAAGAVAWSEIGTVFYDNVLSLGLLGSVLLLVRNWPELIAGKAGTALLAALPLGLTLGLKQTMVVFAFGLCPALLIMLPLPLWQRLRISIAFGLGLTLGLLITGGYWMVHLWQDYANPFFPYFNRIFQSPWGLVSDYRDPAFEPKSLAHWLLFPLFFGFDSRIAAEISFTDFRLPLLFILVPLSPLLGVARNRPLAMIFLALTISYVVWLRLFDIYRYLVGVEMLAPLLIAALLSEWPDKPRQIAILLLFVLLAVTTRPGQWIRVPFESRAVTATLPPIADPDHSLVLLAGHEPLSFLIPSFPASMRFLRIDSTFTNPDQTGVPFNRVMKQQIDSHQGPILALFIQIERHDVVKRLGNVGLRLLDQSCQGVRSPIGAGDYQLCEVTGS